MAKKNLDFYMSLPYSIQIRYVKDETGEYYVARVLELDGCVSHGDTIAEAYYSAREALKGQLEVKLEHGDPIPEPVRFGNEIIVLNTGDGLDPDMEKILEETFERYDQAL